MDWISASSINLMGEKELLVHPDVSKSNYLFSK
jgi:hypothetical protein